MPTTIPSGAMMAKRSTQHSEAEHGIRGPCFTIDRSLRVVSWSAEAQRTSGMSRQEALGRRCWEVRTAKCGARRPAECRGCLPVGERAGAGASVDCVPLPLPGRPDRALVWLVRDGNSVPLLLLGGALGSVLAEDVFSTGLERALELVRRTCRADDAELFLEEPCGRDVVLAAHNGRDRNAFLERDRFAQGDGYPGAVVAGGRPLAARDIASDTEFVRREVCAAGVRRYDCVPVPGASGVLGALGLAWRVPERAPPNTPDVLAYSARLIGMAVSAGLAARREAMGLALAGRGQLDERARAGLEAIRRAAGASGATLLVVDDSLRVERTISCGRAPPIPHGFARAEQWLWARLRQGHGVALHGAADYVPKSLKTFAPSEAPLYCLPLAVEDGLVGAVILDPGAGDPPELPSAALVPLLAMAGEAASRLLRPTRPSAHVSEAPPLDLRCFGNFEVRVGGRLVSPEVFSRRKALTLLKLLVLRAGNPIPRDELCDLLWPETGHEAALRNRLHVTVHALRSAIEPHHADRRWVFVRNEGELYYFNMDVPHRIDLYELKRLSSLAFHARAAGRLTEAVSLGEKAASLYRGELFADEPYADWCLLERANAERRFLDLARALADASDRLGDHDRAVDWLRRALSVDPLLEDVHRSLIELLAAMGRPAEALKQYRACERALREQLGAEPMPETRRLGRLLTDRRRHAPS